MKAKRHIEDKSYIKGRQETAARTWVRVSCLFISEVSVSALGLFGKLILLIFEEGRHAIIEVESHPRRQFCKPPHALAYFGRQLLTLITRPATFMVHDPTAHKSSIR